MKVLLFAPNAGVSLSQGGGTNFVLKQARALARLGHQVVLTGYHAWPLAALEDRHGVSFDGLRDRVRVVAGPGAASYQAHRRLPGKPSAYFALLDPRVGRWVHRTLEREAPDVVWFHDDVPRAARGAAPSARRLLYVHFPQMARSPALVPALAVSRTPGEALQDGILRRLAPRTIELRAGEIVEGLQANSRVTARACAALWGRTPEVMPTYAPVPPADARPRPPEVLSLSAFHRGKNLRLLVRAFRRTRAPHGRLTLIGHARDDGFLGRVRREAAGDPRVRISVDASRAEVDAALQRARIIVSPAEFEPFGVAMLEGMASGLSPFALRSPWSGPWNDLLEEGRFGHGFQDEAELADLLEAALAPEAAPPDPVARERATFFSEERLERQVEGILG